MNESERIARIRHSEAVEAWEAGGEQGPCPRLADFEPKLSPAERNARDAVLGIGGCARIDRERGQICIQEKGHEGPCFSCFSTNVWPFKTPRVEHCEKHGTHPEHDEPCWQCENEALEKSGG